jgi:hypothetical protein
MRLHQLLSVVLELRKLLLILIKIILLLLHQLLSIVLKLRKLLLVLLEMILIQLKVPQLPPLVYLLYYLASLELLDKTFYLTQVPLYFCLEPTQN